MKTTLGISSAGAFFLIWFLIAVLAMMEGGQGALVGLQDQYIFHNKSDSDAASTSTGIIFW